jgi:hypothetical protein
MYNTVQSMEHILLLVCVPASESYNATTIQSVYFARADLPASSRPRLRPAFHLLGTGASSCLAFSHAHIRTHSSAIARLRAFASSLAARHSSTVGILIPARRAMAKACASWRTRRGSASALDLGASAQAGCASAWR